MIHKTLVPDSKTVTVSLKVPAKYVGKKIEIVAFAKNEVQDSKNLSPALPGDPMSIRQFKEWVKQSESSNSVSLDEAKNRWESQRRKLRQLTK
ncbi:MAG: hypothetical protein JST76_06690 [Bacteroidetes bacterium]|nr:hypothetical protein [Bacteroidota bacterium]